MLITAHINQIVVAVVLCYIICCKISDFIGTDNTVWQRWLVALFVSSKKLNISQQGSKLQKFYQLKEVILSF